MASALRWPLLGRGAGALPGWLRPAAAGRRLSFLSRNSKKTAKNSVPALQQGPSQAARAAAEAKLEDQSVVARIVGEERERWKRVDREGREPDLFQKWCKMDGYEKVEKTFLSLPYPAGYFDRLHGFQTELFSDCGVDVDNPLLLSVATMHQSWVNTLHEHPAGRGAHVDVRTSAVLHQANQGLELYGDGILRAAITSHMLGDDFLRCAKIKVLSVTRNKFENNNALGVTGLTQLPMGWVMLTNEIAMIRPLGRIHKAGGWFPDTDDFQQKDTKALISFSSDCMEAFIGALAVAKGVSVAHHFVMSRLVPMLQRTVKSEVYVQGFGDNFDPVTALQERLVRKYKQFPEYKTVDQRGAEWFKVAIMLGDRTVAEGEGGNLQAARKAASEIALRATSGP